MEKSGPSILDYEHIGVPRRRAAARWIAVCAGVLTGELVSLVLLTILQAGGPIFPMTLLYAPAHMLVEWTADDRVLLLVLFALGPLLFGAYALLAALPKRRLTLPLALLLHLVCFNVTLVQRDVASMM